MLFHFFNSITLGSKKMFTGFHKKWLKIVSSTKDLNYHDLA